MSKVAKEQQGKTFSFLHDQFMHGEFKFGSQTKLVDARFVHLGISDESYTHEVGSDQTTSPYSVSQ